MSQCIYLAYSKTIVVRFCFAYTCTVHVRTNMSIIRREIIT